MRSAKTQRCVQPGERQQRKIDRPASADANHDEERLAFPKICTAAFPVRVVSSQGQDRGVPE